MKRTSFFLVLLLMFSQVSVLFAQVSAVPALMNFQGRLTKPDGTPVADGSYSVRFSLWDAASGGAEKWNQTVNPVTVRNGTFAVLLSGFPANTFNSSLFLEIKIGANAPLTPRQPLVTVAYAFKADSIRDNSITSASIADGAITAADIANSTLTADKFASNIFNPIAWLLNGNSGVTSGFLGTTDTNPLEFRVNNRRAMRYSYAANASYRSINVLGGADINSLGVGVIGGTIGGGGYDAVTGTDYPNRVLSDFGVVGGGIDNTAGGFYSVVGGGSTNSAGADYATAAGGALNMASGTRSVVGGGLGNTASGSASTVSGGETNLALGTRATVGGGIQNSAGGDYATIAGGNAHMANGPLSAVGGGVQNVASGYGATIAGGDSNTASGSRSMVAGGHRNVAEGASSFASGQQAQATHDGTFVWNDASDTTVGHLFASTGINQFLIRATGGVGINTNDPQGNALNVAGTAQMTGFKLPTGAGASKVLTSDATGVGTWGQITAAGIVNGTITANKLAAGTLNPLVWLLGGNSGTNPASHFVGTTDNQPLVFKVNNQRALQMQSVDISGYLGINVLGGYWLNSITSGVTQATVFGGGRIGTSEYPNKVTDFGGTVSGGIRNRAGNDNDPIDDTAFATVGGGYGNTAGHSYTTVGGGKNNIASGDRSTVGGGNDNTASSISTTIGGGFGNTASGVSATVGGGGTNIASNIDATIGGGSGNTANGPEATVGGGISNTASGDSATVGGGRNNTASGQYATVGGGWSNRASGQYAIVGGGQDNYAPGKYSFAAGSHARANHDGSFVWADKPFDDLDFRGTFASTAANQFNVRATGGTRIFSNGEATTGVLLAAGGGSWSSASDRNLKTNFQNVDTLDVLDKLAALPMTTWNYKANTDIRHIGLMAQDFYAAFGGLGMDDKHIDTIDADGVAFAAIQGLYRRMQEQQKQIEYLKSVQAENAVLRTQVDDLHARQNAMETQLLKLSEAFARIKDGLSNQK